MACNDCTPLDQIPECTEEIVLGTITPDAEVYIYVKNLYSGYIHRQEALSDGAGILTLDLTKPSTDFYNQNSAYDVWVTLRTDAARIAVSIGEGDEEQAVDCLSISFYKAMDTATL